MFRKYLPYIFIPLTVLLLVSGGLAYFLVIRGQHATPQDYVVKVTPQTFTSPLLSGRGFVTVRIDNWSASTPINDAIAVPVYGDFHEFSPAFTLPTIQPKGSIEIGLPVYPQSSGVWKIVYVIQIHLNDQKKTLAIIKGGVIALQFQSTNDPNKGRALPASFSGYNVDDYLVSPSPIPPKCAPGDADIIPYSDGEKAKSGEKVLKTWGANCPLVEPLTALALWGNLELGGQPSFDVKNVRQFSTTITVPDIPGSQILVYILASQIKFEGEVYYQMFSQTFWILLNVQ